MLAQLDDGIGRVLGRLRAEGLEEQTLIIFLSDNGGPTRELTSSNRPLRGEKGQLLEGGIRVPFVLQWKERLPSGRTVDRLISSLDLLATVLAAAGAEVPVNLDGRNVLPHVMGDEKTSIRTQHYWRVGGRAAFRQGDWKIHRPSGEARWELYDLNADVGETRDLAATDPQRLEALTAMWQKLDAEMVPALWGAGTDRANSKKAKAKR
jgi:arylsulfatase B